MILRIVLSLLVTLVLWVLILRHIVRWWTASHLRMAVGFSVVGLYSLWYVIFYDSGYVLGWIEWPFFGLLALSSFRAWQKGEKPSEFKPKNRILKWLT